MQLNHLRLFDPLKCVRGIMNGASFAVNGRYYAMIAQLRIREDKSLGNEINCQPSSGISIE